MNQPGSKPKPQFRKGQILTAQDLNNIVRMITKRLTAGKGISITSFNGRITISTTTQARE